MVEKTAAFRQRRAADMRAYRKRQNAGARIGLNSSFSPPRSAYLPQPPARLGLSMAAMNKSLAQINKSQDGGQTD